MQAGHKVAHRYFANDEYLHMVNGIIMSEDGYDFRDWFNNIGPEDTWKLANWSIVNICYECGKRVYPLDEVTLDKLNYAHKHCLGL